MMAQLIMFFFVFFLDGGFCTSVREANCTFDIFPFLECNPFCVLPYVS